MSYLYWFNGSHDGLFLNSFSFSFSLITSNIIIMKPYLNFDCMSKSRHVSTRSRPISTRSRPSLDQVLTESRPDLDQISTRSRLDLDQISTKSRPDLDKISTRPRPDLDGRDVVEKRREMSR